MKAFRVEASIVEADEPVSRIRTFIVAAHGPFDALSVTQVYCAVHIGATDWLSINCAAAGFDSVAESVTPGVLATWR